MTVTALFCVRSILTSKHIVRDRLLVPEICDRVTRKLCQLGRDLSV